jgi:gliding motility-associated-like protein
LLLLTSDDNQIELEVIISVPWNMTAYFIERKAPGELNFTPYDTSFTSTFLDTGLINTTEYCYRVKTKGYYDSNGTEDPLFNYSQEACSTPYDFTPPCPPVLEVDANCLDEIDYLSWGGATSCADDVMGYSLYWAPFEGDTLQLYATFNYQTGLSLDSTFTFNESGVEGTIAGCFSVTASDSLLPGPGGVLRQNESVFSNVVCVDNCPFYFLPNIFTPNDDNKNDKFRPFPWKFIKDIDLRVHNRWGIEVFSTQDSDINWDGRHFESGEVLPDGVYFYTVTVYTIRLSGIVPEIFSGEISIHGSKTILE